MSTDGLEQDLTRAFLESTAAVIQPTSTLNAGVGLTPAQSEARMAVLQLTQSGAMSEDANAIFSYGLIRTMLCRSGLQAWTSHVMP